MSQDVFVVAEHLKGALADITWEMLAKGRELADRAGGRLCALLMGKGVGHLAEGMGAADVVLYAEDDRLAEFTAEAHQMVLADLIGERRPRLTLVASTSMGLDLAASVSARLGIPLAGYCKDLRWEDGTLVVTSQLYAGRMLVEAEVEGESAIAAILPGSFRADRGRMERAAPVEAVAVKAPLDAARMRFERLIEPQAGDVDITQAAILVSLGRGIQRKENVPVAQELAEALGGALAASRPVVDQGWLPMTRQVGRSGMIVKPRLYLALGISGAPEHVEGMRDAETIIAVNTDPKAPIFNVAHYGVVEDVLEFVPALTARLATRMKAAA